MDPNYAVIGRDGHLVNSLPDVAQVNQDSTAGRFGTVCAFDGGFLGDRAAPRRRPCIPTGKRNSIVTAGGPGSTNFVPNNVEPENNPNPNAYRKARYYDVTLREAGTTTLSGNATIDKLTLDGTSTRLNIAGNGNLKVWSDFTQFSGWTNIDGNLTTGEAMVADRHSFWQWHFDPRS